MKAWQKRDIERQDLLRTLMDGAHNMQDTTGDPVFLFKVARAVLVHLQQRRKNFPRHDLADVPEFFSGVVFSAIEIFARSQVEADYLFAEFLKKILGSALSSFSAEMAKEQQTDPKLIFQVPSAMAEVPLKGGRG